MIQAFPPAEVILVNQDRPAPSISSLELAYAKAVDILLGATSGKTIYITSFYIYKRQEHFLVTFYIEYFNPCETHGVKISNTFSRLIEIRNNYAFDYPIEWDSRILPGGKETYLGEKVYKLREFYWSSF